MASLSSPKRLGINWAKKVVPGDIPTGPGQADNQFITDRIGHAGHDDRHYACCLPGCASWCRTRHDDDVNLEPSQISREFLKLICIPIPVATLNSYVQTLRVTELLQPHIKSSDAWGIGRAGIQQADKGEFSLLLGAGGERPCCCSASEKPSEFPPLQMIEPHVAP